MKKLLICLLAILTISSAMAFNHGVASAATYNNNDIIDDSVFNNANSMSAASIDNFLNGFSSSCISPNSGFRAIDPTGYNPTDGFQYGGYVTAGQVIYDAGQAYGINPQVLITTLEKEQSLVTGRYNYSGYCNNGDQHKYAAAVGYGCPDSGTTYSYTGLSLYQRNGVVVGDTGTTCVNSATKAGFTQQVIRAAWLLKFGQQRARGNVGWAVIKGNWNNSDDPQSCYGGPMTQGTFARCPSGGATYYDGYTTIDATSVHMDNGPTAALYWYTPHFHGNQLFFDTFTQWFGSTYITVPRDCNASVSNVTCAWQLESPDNRTFQTASISERDFLIAHGWSYDGIGFYVFGSTASNNIPVYRLYSATYGYTWTADTQERTNLLNSGWTDNGVAWYAFAGTTSDNVSIPVYRANSSGVHGLYLDGNLPYGATNEGAIFKTPSGTVNTPILPPSGSLNVYRLWGFGHYMYTTNFSELSKCASGGWSFNGIGWYASATSTTSPVYRLSGWGTHMFTTSTAERDFLASHGWSNEGIGWYQTTDKPVFRFSSGSEHFFTTNVDEAVAQLKHGWQYDSLLADQNTGNVPIVRLNSNSGHFFTGNMSEVASLVKSGYWQYEGIGWYASVTATSSPVYRLSGWGTHMFTTSTAERDFLTSHGWNSEGIGWYGSPSATTSPVYRLNGWGTHMFTTSTAERDFLTSHGWNSEGIGWYGS